MNWQPIETAPKDGTPVLVCGPDINGSVYMDACACGTVYFGACALSLLMGWLL